MSSFHFQPALFTQLSKKSQLSQIFEISRLSKISQLFNIFQHISNISDVSAISDLLTIWDISISVCLSLSLSVSASLFSHSLFSLSTLLTDTLPLSIYASIDEGGWGHAIVKTPKPNLNPKVGFYVKMTLNHHHHPPPQKLNVTNISVVTDPILIKL